MPVLDSQDGIPTPVPLVTTTAFLRRFGLTSLADLPPLVAAGIYTPASECAPVWTAANGACWQRKHHRATRQELAVFGLGAIANYERG
jgi:hypothetical protein